MRKSTLNTLAGATVVYALAADTAYAYIGPGAGLTAIGTFFALVFALLLAIVGFLWYPFKRLLSRRKASNPKDIRSENSTPNQPKADQASSEAETSEATQKE